MYYTFYTKQIKLFLVFFLWLLGATGTLYATSEKTLQQTSGVDYKGVAVRIIQEGIIPAYSDFDFVAGELHNNMRSFCNGTGLKSNVNESFKQMLMLWGGLEWISFGPVGQKNRRKRVSFYPDENDVVARGLRHLMRTEDDESVQDISAGKASYALQGLTALDSLVYGTGITKGGFSCKVATAITKNLETIAREIYEGWSQEFGALYNKNMTAVEAEKIARTMLVDMEKHLQKVQEYKLAMLLKKKGNARDRYIEYRYSGLSFPALLINIQVVEMAIVGAFDKRLSQKEAQKVNALMKNIRDLVEDAKYSLKETVKKDRSRLVRLDASLKKLRLFYSNNIRRIYGIQ